MKEKSTIADSLFLCAIFQLKNITFDVLKVLENSGSIGSQPAIKDDQPSEDTKEQHGFFNA